MFDNEPAKEMYGWPLHFLANIWFGQLIIMIVGLVNKLFTSQRYTIEKHILWIKCTKIRFDTYTKTIIQHIITKYLIIHTEVTFGIN